jgi:UrcA family protein
MNTETQLTRRSISPLTPIPVALVAMFAFASTVALADQPPAPATRQATVSIADLNLSTPKGARTAYERVKIVAEHLCSQLWNSPYRQTYDSCVHETLANAVGRMNTPALAAVQESHASP